MSTHTEKGACTLGKALKAPGKEGNKEANNSVPQQQGYTLYCGSGFVASETRW
jgi:hypothetical protein